nr:7464_t:CDS:2 [Entrophospora candida]
MVALDVGFFAVFTIGVAVLINLLDIHRGLINYECYPLHYGGGCVSSKGQQMTGYPHNYTNNHWQIKIPGSLFDSSRPENQTWWFY